MQRLEVSGAVRLVYKSLGVKGLIFRLRNFCKGIWNINLRDFSETTKSCKRVFHRLLPVRYIGPTLVYVDTQKSLCITR